MPKEPLLDAECALTRAELAMFAHELRGALTVIAGYTDMMRRPLSSPERLAAIDGIHRAVARANAMCSVALHGQGTGVAPRASRQRVQLWALAASVAAEQQAATGREVSVHAPDDIDVIGDEQALSRALGNLVSNAAKYSPTDQPIEVSVSLKGISRGPALAVIEVSDRGPGIPVDQQERVFELFERLERDADTPGSGLGLSIVHDVVEAHGGHVRVLDREGGGTTMRMELPSAE